jgi:integrase
MSLREFAARGRLRDGAVSVKTSQDYRLAFTLFKEFTERDGGVVVSAATSFEEMDRLLESYIEQVYHYYEGHMQHRATRAPLGIYQELGFRFKHHLPDSYRCLTAWSRLHPTRSARPLPRGWADLMAFVIASKGELEAGIVVLLAWEGYLRVGEALGLRREHVMLPERADGLGHVRHCGLRLRETKRGPNQFVRITDPAIIRYLRWLHERTAPGGLLFPDLYAQKLNRLLKWAALFLGLPAVFSMHSCRHGHASDDFLRDKHPDVIRRAGRWAQLFSMEPYLQACAVLTYDLSPPADLAVLLRYSPTIRRLLLQF